MGWPGAVSRTRKLERKGAASSCQTPTMAPGTAARCIAFGIVPVSASLRCIRKACLTDSR